MRVKEKGSRGLEGVWEKYLGARVNIKVEQAFGGSCSTSAY